MAMPTNHWKLGLFVVAGAALCVTAVGVLGARSLRREVGVYVSYFDESVQGLEVGSPIKFRGVTIGSVGKIDVAIDHRHVELTLELGKAALSRLGLDVAAGPADPEAVKKLEQAIDLRVQLAAAGVTGVKFVQLDFFTVVDHPPAELPFPVPKNYIPSTASTMKDLEEAMVRAVNSLPEITAQLTGILSRIDLLVSTAQHKLAEVQPAALSAELTETLAGLRETMTRVNVILVRVNADKGLLQSVERASSALGDTARTANGLASRVDDAMVSVEQAATSIRKLADALEKEPDMLTKGRSAEEPR